MQYIRAKRVLDLTWLGGQGDPLGIVPEIFIWPYEWMVYAQPGSRWRIWDAQISPVFGDTNGSPNFGQTTRPSDSQQKKKRTYWIVNIAVPADQRVKLKECEKKKKLWNMKMALIPFVINAFGTVSKGLVQGQENLEIRGRVKTIQTTALLRSTKMLIRVLGTWGDLLSLRKLMTMHKALHPRDDVDRLYSSREEGGRGFASIIDNVDALIRLMDNIKEHGGGLITAIKNDTENTMTNKMIITRKQNGKKNNSMGTLND